ncbi:hypothetical protein Csa_023932, partial [Cucumis sativus]
AETPPQGRPSSPSLKCERPKDKAWPCCTQTHEEVIIIRFQYNFWFGYILLYISSKCSF